MAKANVEMMETLYNELQTCDTSAKRRNRFDKMVSLWMIDPDVKQIWDLFENVRLLTKRFVKKTVEVVKSAVEKVVARKNSNPRIEWGEKANVFADGVQQLYLIRLLDSAGKLIWSKVGTTAKHTSQRMGQHLNYKGYVEAGVNKIVVDRVYNCGDMDAEYYENLYKSFYMKKFGKDCWQRNDRFTKPFNLEEADKMFVEWSE